MDKETLLSAGQKIRQFFREGLLRLHHLPLVIFVGALWPNVAYADDLIIERHVTVRAAPSQQSQRLDYPDVGTRLTLQSHTPTATVWRGEAARPIRCGTGLLK